MQNSIERNIIEAINSHDLGRLEAELRSANSLLTGSNQAHFASNQQIELRSLLSPLITTQDESAVIYLGDAGLSRIVINLLDGEVSVGLSGVSTDEVKQKWAGFNNG